MGEEPTPSSCYHIPVSNNVYNFAKKKKTRFCVDAVVAWMESFYMDVGMVARVVVGIRQCFFVKNGSFFSSSQYFVAFLCWISLIR